MACEVVNHLQVWTRKKYFKKHFARNIFSQFSQINTRDMTLFSSRYELAMSCISCFGLLIELTYVYTILWGNAYFSSQNDLRCCSGREHQPYKQLKTRKSKIKIHENSPSEGIIYVNRPKTQRLDLLPL